MIWLTEFLGSFYQRTSIMIWLIVVLGLLTSGSIEALLGFGLIATIWNFLFGLVFGVFGFFWGFIRAR